MKLTPSYQGLHFIFSKRDRMTQKYIYLFYLHILTEENSLLSMKKTNVTLLS